MARNDRAAALRVETIRGQTVENRHTVHAVVVDRAGALVARAGDPALIAFWRSCAKPFQAMPLVLEGVAEQFGITAEELALCCASHSSEPRQVEIVRALLAKIGCAERDLRCGPHPPLSEAVAEDYARRGVAMTAVYSNCSGKHAGMLALARHHGWSIDRYTDPEHPVQRRCLAEVSRWTSTPEAHISTAVDGCGVVTFAIPLQAMALAFARLSHAEAGTRTAERMGTDTFRLPAAALRVPQAMLSHPFLIAGAGRPCSVIMSGYPGRVITKVGAAGVYCAALMNEGLGIALKVEDGSGLAAVVALAAILKALGLGALPEQVSEPPVLNTRGETVGYLRGNGTLEHVNDAGASRQGD
ncbi:MAG TPA: asparaginase [Gemmatimonadales bacterium]|nr:asparaginase [Gemmatimonadales bacterium]